MEHHVYSVQIVIFCLINSFYILKTILLLDGVHQIGKSCSKQHLYKNIQIIRKNKRTNKICPKCHKSRKKDSSLLSSQYINKLPSILIFALSPWIDINKCLKFDVSNSSKEYILKGIIYSNSDHFTVRLIDENLNVWYHDGQTTGSFCQRE